MARHAPLKGKSSLPPPERFEALTGGQELSAGENHSLTENLNELNAERARGVYRLRFGAAAVEAAYRRSSRQQRKYPRITLFVILGLSFALAPLYETSLFAASPDTHRLLRIIEWLVVAPTALAAAAATYFELRRDVTYALQTVAVICIWVSALLLRRLDLQGSMHYPSFMIGYVVVAVAIFSGFNWYRIAAGTAILFVFAGLQEYELHPHEADRWIQINGFFLMTLISVMGAYVTEAAHRLAWLNGRAAALLAKTDVLTGLANRMEFNRLLPLFFAQARRKQRIFAIALLDIDHFKRINDVYGHLFGDEVLRVVGKALSQRAARRPLDIVARYGGEEIVVVWYDVAEAHLATLIDALLNAVRSIELATPDGGALSITASIGASWLVPDGSSSPEELLRNADLLLYRAKSAGRNQAKAESYASGESVVRVTRS